MSRAALSCAAVLVLFGCAKPQAPVSKLKAAVRMARAQEPCSSIIAVEWPASWPIPAEGSGGRSYKIFFYPVTGNPSTGPLVHSPAGEAVVDSESGKPSSCVALPGAPKELSTRRWPEAAAALGIAEFDERSASLYAKTEALAAVYARGKRAVGAAALAKDYLRTFRSLAEPDLLPYYYRLNPAFWEWLRETAGDSIPAAER